MGKLSAKAMAVQKDIEKIDMVLSTKDSNAYKSLHIELDGTYQNLIKNWGHSVYGYSDKMGFIYDWLDAGSLQHNLLSMKSKLRGYLLELAPQSVQEEQSAKIDEEIDMNQLSRAQRKLLCDYRKLQQMIVDGRILTIQESDYPQFKDSLEYLERYEYLRRIEIDGDTHLFLKTEAFEEFPEHLRAQEPEECKTMYDNKKVFIVHGHDHHLLQEVELLLRRIGLEPIILMNEANAGRTIIEKIEDLSDVGFGIVLYTGCDEGRKKGTEPLHDRARQNVIFEHGYLYAKLGRGRVVALNDADIELPSDLSGILYISHSASDWKKQLLIEMKTAGLDFDFLKS